MGRRSGKSRVSFAHGMMEVAQFGFDWRYVLGILRLCHPRQRLHKWERDVGFCEILDAESTCLCRSEMKWNEMGRWSGNSMYCVK